MTLSTATPELPVKDVLLAQKHFNEKLGFDIPWYNEAGQIGADSHGDCAIFFRKAAGPIVPVTLWIFTEKIDETYSTLQVMDANIVTPIADMPWGLRQFTVSDPHGHLLHFHHDL